MKRAADFPQLVPIAESWTALRDEARAALAAGERPPLLPLFPEPRGGRAFADRFPVAASMCRGTRGVLAAALSVLAPGDRRAAAPGTVAALLCLDGELVIGGDAVGGGVLVILDGVETRNDGPGEGLALFLHLEAAPESPAARLVRGVVQDAFERGRPVAARAAPGPAGDLDKLAGMWRGAFPDLRLELLELVSDGARVACAVRARGTQTGHFYNVPATGARIAWKAAFFFTVDGDRVAAFTVVWDVFDLLQQLREALRVG